MTAEHAIDAFIDGETVDATTLDAALASADGRAYLLDALSLRRVMNDAPGDVAIAAAHRARGLPYYARAAIVAFALVGLGYAAGARGGTRPGLGAPEATNVEALDAPPEPTRVIELTPGLNWHESKGGD